MWEDTVFWLTKLSTKSLVRPSNTTKNPARTNGVQEGSIASNSWVSVPVSF